MAARLGKVIYWTACGLVAVWALGSVFGFPRSVDDWPYHISVVIVGATVIWAVGRAALYVLAGE
jgi:hypothetical protein